MIVPPLPYSPFGRTSRTPSPPRASSEYGLIPFVTQREGEDEAPDNLVILENTPGRFRLYYSDEDPAQDRDMRGVLVTRCSFNPVDNDGRMTGKPLWKMIHPHRQIMTMQNMRCQVCAGPARTRLGYIFLFAPKDLAPDTSHVLTNQPPVCPKHARAAAALCPPLGTDPTVFLTQSAPLYGVHGTLYGPGAEGVLAVDRPVDPLPYGHRDLPRFLASQVIRRLGSYRAVGLGQLLHSLATSG
ncbi:hypothetical protein [Streptomyces sp. NPDC059906]|uniref:hypothetical protein n=1 Tax=Streptomyces sp. NPDC059906 TaxID=3346997 RepID=UPI0036593B87